jgi:uncharacterized small protein (DUF1192 family)
MVVGSVFIKTDPALAVRIAPLAGSGQTGNNRKEHAAVDEDELEPRRKTAKKRDLTLLAIAELEAYIVELEDEIGRTRQEIAAKRKQRGGAESLFKR